MPNLKRSGRMPHIINSYQFGTGGGGGAFGLSSRDFGSSANSYYVKITDSGTAPTAFQGIGNNDAFTIACWIKPGTDAGNGDSYWFPARTIVELRKEGGAGTTAAFAFGLSNPTAGQRYLRIGRADNYVTSNEAKNSNTLLTNSAWSHVAVVINNDDYTLYVNGISDGSGSFTTATGDCSVGTATANFFIGARTTNTGAVSNEFDGKIADLRIYNAAKTGTEIGNLAAGTDVSSALIGWWFLNADDVSDYSAEGNGGTNVSTIFSTDGPLD